MSATAGLPAGQNPAYRAAPAFSLISGRPYGTLAVRTFGAGADAGPISAVFGSPRTLLSFSMEPPARTQWLANACRVASYQPRPGRASPRCVSVRRRKRVLRRLWHAGRNVSLKHLHVRPGNLLRLPRAGRSLEPRANPDAGARGVAGPFPIQDLYAIEQGPEPALATYAFKTYLVPGIGNCRRER